MNRLPPCNYSINRTKIFIGGSDDFAALLLMNYLFSLCKTVCAAFLAPCFLLRLFDVLVVQESDSQINHN